MTTDIAQFLPATLELVFVAGVLMVVIGVPLGILSARISAIAGPTSRRASITLLGVFAPGFVWAIILVLAFIRLDLMPVIGPDQRGSLRAAARHRLLSRSTRCSPANRGLLKDVAWHIVLPAFALALSGIGQAARLTRSNMVESL